MNFQSLGFRKDDSDFIEALNQQIAALRASGKLVEILKPFGFTEHDIPDDTRTAAAICAGS